MQMSAAEGRVLGCLIAHQAAGPDSHALSLDEVRFACNHGGGDEPVAFDDRTVDDALVALKSKGLARFVQAGRNLGPVLYRHRADERWRLGPSEQAVLAALLLGGPQTVDEVQLAVRRQRAAVPLAHSDSEPRPEDDVEAALDALAGRTPTPFAIRVAPQGWGDETLWAEVLTGQPSPEDLFHARRSGGGGHGGPAPSGAGGSAPSRLPLGERQPTLAEVLDRMISIERRLASIEAALATLTDRDRDRGSGASSRRPTHESSRLIR